MGDADQPDPWAASIKSGNAPKPKAKAEANSWKGFKPGEAEPLSQEMAAKDRSGQGGGGKKAWKSKAMPSGPNLPRKRVTPEKVVGQVLEWKGKYGWIQPVLPLQHPKAFKHGGKIFISVTDLDGHCSYLDSGTMCEFYVFEDSAGIGAERCVPVNNSGYASKGGIADAASIAQIGGSRPSTDRGAKGRGKGAKGAGGKASSLARDANYTGMLAQSAGEMVGFTGRGLAPQPGDARGLAGDAGSTMQRGARASELQGAHAQASKGDHASIGKAGAKGGRSGKDHDSFQSKGKMLFNSPGAQAQPQFGKGAAAAAAAAGPVANAGLAPAAGAGSWDAFNSQRGAANLRNEPQGEPFGLQPLDNTFMGQSLFPDQGLGFPMVPNAGPDAQRAWEFASNFHAAQAAMVPPSLLLQGFPGPSYAGDMEGFVPPALGGFGVPSGTFPSPTPAGLFGPMI